LVLAFVTVALLGDDTWDVVNYAVVVVAVVYVDGFGGWGS
jgi:hypothetical protein